MKIQNMVATAKATKSFDLQSLNNLLEGSEFDPSGAKWLKMRLPESNHYIAFYSSGKFLITGVRSKKELEKDVNQVVEILNKANIEVEIESIDVHNLVVMDQFELNHSLEDIMITLQDPLISYEPEQFLGLIYKSSNATFLLFGSGKVICTGCKTIEEAENEILKFKSKIEQITPNFRR